MKVVIDTNVFVSSFFGGLPKKIIDMWTEGQLTLCLTNEIIDEYVDVLTRMGLGGTSELGELLSLFRTGHCSLFTVQTPSLSISEDPDDDKCIEAAVAHDAVTVTGHRLLSWEEKDLRLYRLLRRHYCVSEIVRSTAVSSPLYLMVPDTARRREERWTADESKLTGEHGEYEVHVCGCESRGAGR